MEKTKGLKDYITNFLKWTVIAVIVGGIGGVVGSVFHIGIDKVTELRAENPIILYFLPIGGIVIAALYAVFKKSGRIDTNRVIEAARGETNIPLVMIPLIFISTIITHMLGGSAGREGAALQLGGSIGYNTGKLFKLNKNDMKTVVMTGMSSVFAALFGTPLTAAVFSIEVSSVGIMNYSALLPSVIGATVASQIAACLGVSPVFFGNVFFGAFSSGKMIKVILLSVLCACVAISFCTAIKKCEFFMEKYIANKYLRAVIGGSVIVILTLVLRTYDYNGAGMEVVKRAISGEARPEAFLLKIIFTAITISAGFKGGEIVPSFFIGSTFGCVAGTLIGLEPGFAAAIGFITLFAAVVNCPIASVLLACEVFGGEGMLFFAAACAVSYLMSGNFGLYKSQKIVHSKLTGELTEYETK